MTSPLFKPLQLGAISLSHRVVMAPLTRMRAGAPDNVPTELSVCCSDRAAEAVSHLHALFSETGKRIETVAPSKGGSSRVAPGSTL